MFTLDSMIETIQNSQKAVINTVVTNDEVKTAMVKFVDAQSAYTRDAYRAGVEAATSVFQETMKLAQEATRFDWTKFGQTTKTARA